MEGKGVGGLVGRGVMLWEVLSRRLELRYEDTPGYLSLMVVSIRRDWIMIYVEKGNHLRLGVLVEGCPSFPRRNCLTRNSLGLLLVAEIGAHESVFDVSASEEIV